MICLRCADPKKEIKPGDVFCPECEEKEKFSKSLRSNFGVALDHVVKPDFWNAIGEPLATQMKAAAYHLYKIGFVDGVKHLGEEALKKGSV